MKKLLLSLSLIFPFSCIWAENVTVESPDGRLSVVVSDDNGNATYSVLLDGKEYLLPSPLGLQTNNGDYSKGLRLTSHNISKKETSYIQPKIKRSQIDVEANVLDCEFTTPDDLKMGVTFHVADNNVALRYSLPQQKGRGSVRIMKEMTGYRFPEGTTTFLTPQSDAMIGWKRTKPSYEEEYKADAAMSDSSQYGHGYTFPALFRTPGDGWVLLSETEVDSRYCGSRLSDYNDGIYTIEFPMPEENNGNGTSEPAFALPGVTPWRTISVGDNLSPIVESTIVWDVVEPRYEASKDFDFGKSVWSWILWQDNSINYEDQIKFIDLAKAMGFKYFLVDCAWDVNIGRERMEDLIKYARSQGVEPFLWYSSSGYWNDISQSPINCMDNSIIRKKEMDWLEKNGVKGIKVDFFGGDKQETMRLYEEILSDANDHGLMVIFHGCTLPRGWERMYPNYVGSEAVLASENLIFQQHFCDTEAFCATLHPFIRNSVGCMEFGGTFLNKRLNKKNNGGSTRRTTDDFELATAVLFQNPIQNFALAPNNLDDAPAYCLDFMRAVPTTWEDTQFIEGYPGKNVVLARRNGGKWYMAGVNAEETPLKIKRKFPLLAGKKATLIANGTSKELKPTKDGRFDLTIPQNDGFVLIIED